MEKEQLAAFIRDWFDSCEGEYFSPSGGGPDTIDGHFDLDDLAEAIINGSIKP